MSPETEKFYALAYRATYDLVVYFLPGYRAYEFLGMTKSFFIMKGAHTQVSRGSFIPLMEI